MAKFSVRKDDTVKIIAGKDKGKTAVVTAINRDSGRALLEGKDITVNKKAVKARKATDKGGIIEQPASVDISNIMPICGGCNRPVRVGYKVIGDKKVRTCAKCGEELVTKKMAVKKEKATKKKEAEATAVAEPKTEAKAAVRKKAKPADTTTADNE
ncbi:MAG: 50S ribosomal protein L24 [Firmicutes bacterium]|nr:50S ribosomal protein L24 [Bacillota bacterium]